MFFFLTELSTKLRDLQTDKFHLQQQIEQLQQQLKSVNVKQNLNLNTNMKYGKETKRTLSFSFCK